jgi:hypothetical protein
MSVYTARQRPFMAAELARLRAGKRTSTGITEQRLRDFASKGQPSRGTPPARSPRPPLKEDQVPARTPPQ